MFPATFLPILTQPIEPASQLVTAIVNAVQGAGLTAVQATSLIYNTSAGAQVIQVIIHGASTFTGFPSTFTGAIRDLAGNPLQANTAAGATTFTIQLGNGIEYGDAPAIYPSASHLIKPGYYLGVERDCRHIPKSFAHGQFQSFRRWCGLQFVALARCGGQGYRHGFGSGIP